MGSHILSRIKKNRDKIYHKPHWGQATNNEIRYTLFEDGNISLDEEREIIQNAAALWNEKFKDFQLQGPQDPIMLIYIEPEYIDTAQIVFYQYDLEERALAQTDFECVDNNNHIQEVSIFVDMTKINNSKIEEGNKAGIIAHEFGHALGLAHVSDENALMYGPSALAATPC